MSKLESEILFIRQIATRAIEAHDEMVAGLTSSQKGSRLLRRLGDQRERLETLVQCARDADAALLSMDADGGALSRPTPAASQVPGTPSNPAFKPENPRDDQQLPDASGGR